MRSRTRSAASPHIIPADAVAPRNDEERYRVYVRSDDDLTLLATAADAGGVGLAIFTNDEDCREAGLRGLIDLGVLGVLDAVTHRWIVLPWERGSVRS